MTFAKAKQTHLVALAQLGWATKPSLKTPHATSPDGRTRLYFKSQAVYATFDRGSLNSARSLHCDSRRVDTAQLITAGIDLAEFLRTN